MPKLGGGRSFLVDYKKRANLERVECQAFYSWEDIYKENF